MALYLDPNSWSGTSYTDYFTWADALTPKSASDTLLAVLTEAPTASRLTFTDDSVVPALSPEVGYSPADQPKSASDTLLVGIQDLMFSLVRSDQITPKTAVDTLLPVVTEAPTTSVLLGTDDPLVPIIVPEVGYPPGPILKTGSDTLLPVLLESWSLGGADVGIKTGSDTLLVGITETSLAVPTEPKAASDTLLVGITETSSLLKHEVRQTTDTLTPILTDTSRPISTIDYVDKGLLPPGWTMAQLNELAGIALPWRVQPHNVTPTQGWMPRKYWAVYDEKGRLRAADRWEKTAAAQAWTQFYSGKQSARI